MRVPGANWSLASLRTYSCAASGHSEPSAVPSLPSGRRQSTANSHIARTRDWSDPCSARAPIRLLPVPPCIRHSTGGDLPQTERVNTPSRPTKELTPSLNTEGVMPSPFSSSARSASMSVGPATQVLQRSAYRSSPIPRIRRGSQTCRDHSVNWRASFRFPSVRPCIGRSSLSNQRGVGISRRSSEHSDPSVASTAMTAALAD